MTDGNDEKLIINRFIELANKAYNNNYPSHTNFLDLYEQSLLIKHKKLYSQVLISLEGGYERKCATFYPNFYLKEDLEIPYKVIKIIPNKLSDANTITHRDILGAIINTGISRNIIGDIILKDDGLYVFCMDNMTEHIKSNLFNIRKTTVNVEIIEKIDHIDLTPKYKSIKNTVASIRLDSIIKVGFSISRERASELIKSGRVSVNNKLSEKISSPIDEGSFISIKGYGKIKLNQINEKTKKNRIFVEIHKF